MPLHTRASDRLPRLRRTAALVALTTALAVPLAACGDDTSDRPSSNRTAGNGDVYNDADVAFATEMIQHHAQALSMVDLADGRPLDPQVQQLTEAIRAAQGPEIETMSDWLTAWDQEVPETMRDHSNAGHDMGGDMSDRMEGMDPEHSDMPGMMSAEEMDELQDASDAEFQDLWLEMMVEHHEGAVEMARTEQEDGQFADAIALAQEIQTAQQQEIETMEGLLD